MVAEALGAENPRRKVQVSCIATAISKRVVVSFSREPSQKAKIKGKVTEFSYMSAVEITKNKIDAMGGRPSRKHAFSESRNNIDSVVT